MGNASTRTTDRSPRDTHGGAVAQRRHDPATPDPQAVLGNRAARMLLLQPKLIVGASNDALEIEADRVAAEVVRSITAGPAPAQADHECGDGCDIHRSTP